ncbi:hypothetical protein Y032_0695g1600 [Ancylostoma ceylanicum]|uniref:Uncharacterized protein n=1 Tax=Ancylostoma ceylanicum TaxID=53326 RepID=A0A016WID2_9BILA|nr:hypothetical protein Y032_0695g1600 [Ancylostoma ceylanicum]
MDEGVLDTSGFATLDQHQSTFLVSSWLWSAFSSPKPGHTIAAAPQFNKDNRNASNLALKLYDFPGGHE